MLHWGLQSANYHGKRRRTLLTLVGLIWLLQGWQHGHSMVQWQFGRLGPDPVSDVLSSHWSGLLWVICGLVGVAFGVFPRRKMSDALGFNALLIPPLLWTFLSCWSWVIFVATRGESGSPRMWVQAVTWLCAIAVLLITAGWPDPDHTHRKGE